MFIKNCSILILICSSFHANVYINIHNLEFDKYSGLIANSFRFIHSIYNYSCDDAFYVILLCVFLLKFLLSLFTLFVVLLGCHLICAYGARTYIQTHAYTLKQIIFTMITVIIILVALCSLFDSHTL